MRILYGVTGEGLGHAMRSRVIAEHLRQRGHTVQLVASGRARGYLARYFPDVEEIPGFTLAYARGGIARMQTLRSNYRAARGAIRDCVDLYRWPVAAFQPEVCISDLDSFAHLAGRLFGRPVISIDHHHVLDRCKHVGLRRRYPIPLTRAFVRAKLPGCAHYIVTSFYQPPLRQRARDSTTLVGPILRREVLDLEPTTGDHVLVYQTATRDLVEPLAALGDHKFVVYGCGPGKSAHDHITFRPFDETQFLADLASARAVICNGGYTLMSEALYLGKPVLSVPLRRHGEQLLNARYLEALGLGRTTPEPDADAFRAFLRSLPPTRRIAPGNELAFAALDRILDEVLDQTLEAS